MDDSSSNGPGVLHTASFVSDYPDNASLLVELAARGYECTQESPATVKGHVAISCSFPGTRWSRVEFAAGLEYREVVDAVANLGDGEHAAFGMSWIGISSDMNTTRSLARVLKSNFTSGVEGHRAPTTQSMFTAPNGTGLVVRTAYGDNAKWREVWRLMTRVTAHGFQAALWPVQDRSLDGLSEDEIRALLPETPGSYVIVVDEQTLVAEEHPVLVVDLSPTTAGRSFRAAATSVQEVENNLTISNVSFEEFLGAAQRGGGVFRGF